LLAALAAELEGKGGGATITVWGGEEGPDMASKV